MLCYLHCRDALVLILCMNFSVHFKLFSYFYPGSFFLLNLSHLLPKVGIHKNMLHKHSLTKSLWAICKGNISY